MKKHTLLAMLIVACTVGAGTVSAARRAAVPAFDVHWLRAAAQDDAFEMTMGRMGLQKGSGQLCSVAQMLVTDHKQSLTQTRKVAVANKILVPTAPNPLQQVLLEQLSKQTGTAFQQLFMAIGQGGHRLSILETKEAQAKASLPAVRALARQELPTLRKHLTMLNQAAAQSTSGSGTTAATGGTTTTAGATAAAATGTTTTGGTSTTSGSTSGSAAGCAGAQATSTSGS